MSLARAARWYAERYGLHIFPLVHKGKDPAIPGGHGHLDAAPDASWWEFLPASNIGLSCRASGIVCVDIDDILADLPGPMPDTWVVKTGRGTHHYFSVPPGMAPGWRGIRKQVDIKWDGYVVMPPSVHPLGHRYHWEASGRIGDVPLAQAPDWLLKPAHRVRTVGAITIPAEDTLIGRCLAALDRLGAALPGGKSCVVCPWRHEHSPDRRRRRDSSTVLFGAEGAVRIGRFHCSHSACIGRNELDVLQWLPEDLRRSFKDTFRREFAVMRKHGMFV